MLVFRKVHWLHSILLFNILQFGLLNVFSLMDYIAFGINVWETLFWNFFLDICSSFKWRHLVIQTSMHYMFWRCILHWERGTLLLFWDHVMKQRSDDQLFLTPLWGFSMDSTRIKNIQKKKTNVCICAEFIYRLFSRCHYS